MKDGVKTKVVSLKGVRWCDKEGKVPFLSKKECISTIRWKHENKTSCCTKNDITIKDGVKVAISTKLHP